MVLLPTKKAVKIKSPNLVKVVVNHDDIEPDKIKFTGTCSGMGRLDSGYGHCPGGLRSGATGSTYAEFVSKHSKAVAAESIATMEGDEIVHITRGSYMAQPGGKRISTSESPLSPAPPTRHAVRVDRRHIENDGPDGTHG